MDLTFPDPQSPIKIEYEFSDKIEKIFEQTTEVLGKKLKYARYAADNYLLQQKTKKKNEKIVKTLIKITIIKRLESSVAA